ncbi:hypothetical protein FB451DRAFT_1556305, partial [Mycena latifolia]
MDGFSSRPHHAQLVTTAIATSTASAATIALISSSGVLPPRAWWRDIDQNILCSIASSSALGNNFLLNATAPGTMRLSTARDLAVASKVPFLGLAASSSLSIMEKIKAMNSSKNEYIELVEQIHELMSAVLTVYQTTQIDGILPPAVLHDISKFAECLNNIDSCLKAQQGFGRIRRLLKVSEHEIQ